MAFLCETPSPTRRALLGAGAGCFSWAFMPRWAHAAGARDTRFITIILRGALDGLSAVAPIGDPDYAGLHGAIALGTTGKHAALPLDGFFALNPAMPAFAELFAAKQAAIVHATATGYRDRSHFDGQDVLESGQPAPGIIGSGWLNRALSALPEGEAVAPRGLAVGAVSPLVMRGPAPVLGWAPQNLPTASDDLARRVLALYDQRDPDLHAALGAGLTSSRLAGNDAMAAAKGRMDMPDGMRQAAQGAARLLAADDGPRIAALAFDGWDTHINEGGATGRLAVLLGGLDGAIRAFKDGLGAAWADTTILAVTEFGRTARINGTTGTDHGTGTVAFLAGGAVKGRARAGGLARPESRQTSTRGRDLRPTIDLRAIMKGALNVQWGLSDAVLTTQVFPGSEGIAANTTLFV